MRDKALDEFLTHMPHVAPASERERATRTAPLTGWPEDPPRLGARLTICRTSDPAPELPEPVPEPVPGDEPGDGPAAPAAPSASDLIERAAGAHLAQPIELGRGGFAVVLSARLDGVPLAVKVAKPSSKGVANQVLEAFAREARLMRSAGFPHEHLCALFGTCTIAGCPAIVLDYFGGGALSDALGIRSLRYRRPRPELAALAERWRLAPQLASGLAHLHVRGILHCDIKTSNVLLRRNERHALGHAVISDFGASSMSKREVMRHAGTARYMAPEVRATAASPPSPRPFVLPLSPLPCPVPPLRASPARPVAPMTPRLPTPL
jgi:hypothetical protein